MLNPNQVQAIEDAQTAAFIDDRFAPLDTRGLPNFQQTLPLEDAEDKYGFWRLEDATDKSKGLREFLRQPPQDTLEEIAPHNPAVAADLADRRMLAEFRKFQRTHPGYFAVEENRVQMLDWLQHHNAAFTADNLTKAYAALTRSGSLEVRPGQTRDLTEGERLTLARQVVSGDPAGALHNYIMWRLGSAENLENVDSYQQFEAIINNPRYRSILDQGAWDIWRWGNHEYDGTIDQEFRQWAVRASQGKPLSVPFLNTLWNRYQESKRLATRDAILGIGANKGNVAEPEAAPDLDSLSDDQINQLRQDTLRAYSRQRQKRV